MLAPTNGHGTKNIVKLGQDSPVSFVKRKCNVGDSVCSMNEKEIFLQFLNKFYEKSDFCTQVGFWLISLKN